MSLNWDKDITELIRGCDIEATTDASDIKFLGPPISDAWLKAFEISRKFTRSDHPLAILVETWPDTGRLIFRISDKKEFARLVLNCPILEREYYKIRNSDDAEFEANYRALVNSVSSLVESSLPDDFSTGFDDRVRLIVRDSDDRETEKELAV